MKVDEIYHQLEKLGGKVNCHSGNFYPEDILENAEYIRDLLDEYIKLKG